MHDFLDGKFNPGVITQVSHIGSKAVQLAEIFCFSTEKHKKKYFVPTVLVKIFSFSVYLAFFFPLLAFWQQKDLLSRGSL